MTTIKEVGERVIARNGEFWWLEVNIPRALMEAVEFWCKAHEIEPDILVAYLITTWIEQDCEVA